MLTKGHLGLDMQRRRLEKRPKNIPGNMTKKYPWTFAGNIELMEALLSTGVEVDSQSDAGTPLVWASGHGQQDALKLLLKHKADVRLYLWLLLMVLFLFSLQFWNCSTTYLLSFRYD